MLYHSGASAWLTVPLSGQSWPEVACTSGLIGDIPPPSVALTLQRTTPVGVNPELLTSAHRACSSTVVPDAVLEPPRETNVGAGVGWPPFTPAAATSANAWAMLWAPFAVTPAGSPVG